jgi:hypothetical protein
MAKFDWYQSTIDEYPRVIADALMQMPGAHDLKHGRGRMNYRESTAIVGTDGHMLATILHGGLNGAPNALGTGENAEAFAHIVRMTWPDAHRVTRFDSAEDVIMPFSEAHSACQAIAAELGIRGQTHVPDDAQDGATYNMGAPVSRNRIRLYERGKKLRGEGQADAHPDLVRFELQQRPNDIQAKQQCARIAPDEAWGATPLSRRVAGVFGRDVQRVIVRQRLVSTYDTTHHWFLRQYGAHMTEMLARHGSWGLVGEQIGLDLA